MRRFYLFLSTIALLTIGSCNKSQQHFKVDAMMSSYFSYGKGSTWNYYALSDTTDHETVVVADKAVGKMVWDNMDQEFIQIDLNSDKDSSFKIRAIADDQITSRAVIFVKDTFYRHTIEWSSTSGILTGLKGTGDSFTLHPVYSIAGKDYTNVIELKPFTPRIYKKLFIAQNIGIIRKELLSGKIYVLKSYTVQ